MMAARAPTSREGAGRHDGVLPVTGVDHQERVVRQGDLTYGAHFVHQRFVDRESTGRVDDDHVASESRRLFEAVTCDVDRLRGFSVEDVDADLGTEDAKVVRRPPVVGSFGRDQVGLAPLCLEPPRPLRRRRRLTGALETGQEDDVGGFEA